MKMVGRPQRLGSKTRVKYVVLFLILCQALLYSIRGFQVRDRDFSGVVGDDDDEVYSPGSKPKGP
jgi:hypothetical protein